jgi:hypothetical protein
VDGVKGAVGRLDGVQHVEVEFGTRLVRITPMRDRTIDLAAIGPAVRAGSTRMTRMRIVADGAVEPGARFRIAGWPEAFAIDGAAPPEGHASIRANVHFAAERPTLHALAD